MTRNTNQKANSETSYTTVASIHKMGLLATFGKQDGGVAAHVQLRRPALRCLMWPVRGGQLCRASPAAKTARSGWTLGPGCQEALRPLEASQLYLPKAGSHKPPWKYNRCLAQGQPGQHRARQLQCLASLVWQRFLLTTPNQRVVAACPRRSGLPRAVCVLDTLRAQRLWVACAAGDLVRAQCHEKRALGAMSSCGLLAAQLLHNGVALFDSKVKGVVQNLYLGERLSHQTSDYGQTGNIAHYVTMCLFVSTFRTKPNFLNPSSVDCSHIYMTDIERPACKVGEVSNNQDEDDD